VKLDNIIAFALEGPDKVGKATQSKMLTDALVGLVPLFDEKKVSVRVHRVEIPSKNHTCYDKIYDMLNRRPDGSAPAVDHPEVFQTFQVANRFHVQEDVKLMSADPTIIVFDRWVASSWAYGSASGVPDSKIEIINDGLLVPDITFVLQGKGFDRPEQADDAYEDDDGFQSKVRQAYERWSRGRAHVRTVNADRDKEVVHEEILSIAKKQLSDRGLI
jgi:thymidylate kinase